jgi:hypothetical protein
MGGVCSGGEVQVNALSDSKDGPGAVLGDKETCVYGVGPKSSDQCCWDILNSVACRYVARGMPCPYSHDLKNAGQTLEIYSRRDMMDKKLEFRTQRALRAIAQHCREHFSEAFVRGFDIFEEMLRLARPLLMLLRAYNAAEKRLRSQEEIDFETLKELGEKKEHWSDVKRDTEGNKGPVLPLQSDKCVSILGLQRQAKVAQQQLKMMFAPEYPADATWNGENIQLILPTKVAQAKKVQDERKRLLKEKKDARRKGLVPAAPPNATVVAGIGGRKSKVVDMKALRCDALLWWIDTAYDPGTKTRQRCEEKLGLMARMGDGNSGQEAEEQKPETDAVDDGGDADAAEKKANTIGFRKITDAARVALQFSSIERMLKANSALEALCDVRHFENRHRRPSLIGYADLRYLVAVELPQRNRGEENEHSAPDVHICEIELQHWEYVKAKKAGVHDHRQLEKMVTSLCTTAVGLKEAGVTMKPSKQEKQQAQLLKQKGLLPAEKPLKDAANAANAREKEEIELSLKKTKAKELSLEMKRFILASLHGQGRKKKIRLGKERKPREEEGDERGQERFTKSKKKRKRKKRKKSALADNPAA